MFLTETPVFIDTKMYRHSYCERKNQIYRGGLTYVNPPLSNLNLPVITEEIP